MVDENSSNPLNFLQKFLLVAVTLFLIIILLILRGGLIAKAPLDQLALNSIEPNVAFSNKRPTVIEFYADWCEACRQMAPSMINIESRYKDKVNLVMVNVENERWQDLIDKYEVNGIPQLNFFDKNSNLKGVTIGLKSEEILLKLFNSLSLEEQLPSSLLYKNDFNSKITSKTRDYNIINLKPISPMSHT